MTMEYAPYERDSWFSQCWRNNCRRNSCSRFCNMNWFPNLSTWGFIVESQVDSQKPRFNTFEEIQHLSSSPIYFSEDEKIKKQHAKQRVILYNTMVSGVYAVSGTLAMLGAYSIGFVSGINHNNC